MCDEFVLTTVLHSFTLYLSDHFSAFFVVFRWEGRGGGGGGLARCCTSHSVLDFCVTCFGLSWSTAQTISYTTYKERNLYPRTAYINQHFILFFNQKLTTTDLNH